MFKKRTCKKCKKKISNEYDFCPYCGKRLEDNEDYGLLGKNDSFFREEFNEFRLPIGFNSLFNVLVKNLNKQFREINEDKSQKKRDNLPKKGGISIKISTSGNQKPEIKINSFGNIPEFREKKKELKKKAFKTPALLGDSLSRFSKLPREEPLTEIRRLSDKIIYEIKIPGVESLKDISISQLESSIEIKAVSKDKAYFKLIPIKMAIRGYSLLKGKLVLELEDK